jgi:hypothetical protein
MSEAYRSGCAGGAIRSESWHAAPFAQPTG